MFTQCRNYFGELLFLGVSLTLTELENEKIQNNYINPALEWIPADLMSTYCAMTKTVSVTLF